MNSVEAPDMPVFIGTKVIKACPMTRGEYNKYRNWQQPANEDPNEAGYLIEYTDGGAANDERHLGYITYSPADVFKRAYKLVGKWSFGQAIEAMKLGFAVRRTGWNGKGMFIYYVQANEYPATSPVAKAHWGQDAVVPYGAYIAMKTAQENVVPWLASQTDMLAEDWEIAE